MRVADIGADLEVRDVRILRLRQHCLRFLHIRVRQLHRARILLRQIHRRRQRNLCIQSGRRCAKQSGNKHRCQMHGRPGKSRVGSNSHLHPYVQNRAG